MEEQLIKCEIVVNKIMFPKYVQTVESGEYAIFTSKIAI